jgi:hypothetical protein
VQFSEISKKNLVPILIFHLADRFDTFHQSDFHLIRALFKAQLHVAFRCRGVIRGVLGSRL